MPDSRAGGLAERADRAGDEHVAADGFPRLTRQLDRGRVDRLELVLEKVFCELAPVRAEAVRLDQVCAGVDEADVERDHGVRRPQIRLFRTAKARHGARDESAHAAVADDHGAVRKAFFEAPGHDAMLVKRGGQP